MPIMLTRLLAAAAVMVCSAFPAAATQIDFTGGAGHMPDDTIRVTDNSNLYYGIDYYDQAGFRFTNIGDWGWIGNYYNDGDDVFHTHWAGGGQGYVTRVRAEKIDGSTFDLNAFDITSNTDYGGTSASGNERLYLHASLDGIHSSYTVLMPSEDWARPATQVVLGAQFRNIKAFWFTPANMIVCMGIDNIILDEAGPGQVPEPGTFALTGLALAGLALRRRRSARGLPKPAVNAIPTGASHVSL